jgi:GNAT superfamily N-acetyltransferase
MTYATYTPLELKQSSVIEDNLLAYFAYFCRAPQSSLHRAAETVQFSNNISYPHYLFNLVLQSKFTSPPQAFIHIDRILKEAQAGGMPVFWYVEPSTEPVNLGYYLELHNFTHLLRSPGMAIDLADLVEDFPTPADVRIERVKNIKQLRQFVDVLAAKAKMPESVSQQWFEFEVSLGFDYYLPRQRYLGYWRDEPVATSCLFSGAGVAGLYHVAVLPQARGLGIGPVMSLVPMQDARWLGHRVGVLISTPQDENTHRRLGFQPINEFNLYMWSNEHPEASG